MDFGLSFNLILKKLLIFSGLEIYFVVRKWEFYYIYEFLEVIFLNLLRKTKKLV